MNNTGYRKMKRTLPDIAKGKLPEFGPDDPQPGSLWLHAKGGLYRVLTCALMESSLKQVVVYRREATSPHVWVRTLQDFRNRFSFVAGS